MNGIDNDDGDSVEAGATEFLIIAHALIAYYVKFTSWIVNVAWREYFYTLIFKLLNRAQDLV